jgi:ankyrin repeat protein
METIEELIDIIGKGDLELIKTCSLSPSSIMKISAKNGYLHIVKYLIKNGYDPTSDRHLALMNAVEGGNMDIIKYLVEEFYPKFYNNSILDECAKFGHLEAFKFFIEKGCDPDRKRSHALQFACENGHLEIVIYLDSLKCIHDQASVFRWATEGGHLSIIKYFVELGWEIILNPILHYAVIHNCLDIVKYIIELGCDPTWCNDFVLTFADSKEHYSIVKYLINCGCDPVSRNYQLVHQSYDYRHHDIYNHLLICMTKKQSMSFIKTKQTYLKSDLTLILITDKIFLKKNSLKNFWLKKILRPTSMAIQLTYL